MPIQPTPARTRPLRAAAERAGHQSGFEHAGPRFGAAGANLGRTDAKIGKLRWPVLTAPGPLVMRPFAHEGQHRH